MARDLSPTLVGSTLSPLQRPRPADDEDEPADIATPAVMPTVTSSSPWHRFSRGAEAGNFLRDQLEWLDWRAIALAQREPLAARLRQHCRRAGRAAQADDVVAWLDPGGANRTAWPSGGSVRLAACAAGDGVLATGPRPAESVRSTRCAAPTCCPGWRARAWPSASCAAC